MCSRIGNYTDAIKYYDKALVIQPNSISSTGIIINKANDPFRLGRYEQAIKSYDKALVVKPNDPDLLINKAHTLFHMTNYSGAIKYFYAA
ncbi:MAG: tetratricopeptide repeat protein [Candidatus Nitrosopolaris sp.]